MEFGLIAPMFIAILVATIEIGMLEVISTNLDTAVMAAARKIRTGQSDRPATAAEFTTLICDSMIDDPADCRGRLAISVQKMSDFATAQSAANTAPAGQFDSGGPGDIILVRATYRWPLVLPMYAGNFQLAGPTEALLDARAAFRNEPYA
ncbi:TadE/TadG family type IV pilus assembly protein [Phenylobacterium sp. LjRoot225]|uniref:TadE/TadG family type IV pilus assembly protein n=1 Tax=Phenylobacterium sp. LjRoot225 TaxID=3342285 RepID=UPI003ECF84F1